MMNRPLERLARDLAKIIEREIEYCGILYRIFNRAKTHESIARKIKSKGYSVNGKLMQDAIGIRITLYFMDDIDIVYKVLKSHPNYISETRDNADETSFKPQRLNLVFRLNKDHGDELISTLESNFKEIDRTFEIQIRSVLSEGWHEVEHDLRYKNQKDWENHQDLSRIFNGIYATLETQDWSIIAVFDKLAYRHYKMKNWNAMIRNHIRIRFTNHSLSNDILSLLDLNDGLSKEFLKVNRKEFLKKIVDEKLRIPLTMDNTMHLVNLFFIKDKRILKILPEILKRNKSLKKYIG